MLGSRNAPHGTPCLCVCYLLPRPPRHTDTPPAMPHMPPPQCPSYTHTSWPPSIPPMHHQVYSLYHSSRRVFAEQLRESRQQQALLKKRLTGLRQRYRAEELRREGIPYHLQTDTGENLTAAILETGKELSILQTEEPVFEFRPGDVPFEVLVLMSKVLPRVRPRGHAFVASPSTPVGRCWGHWGA